MRPAFGLLALCVVTAGSHVAAAAAPTPLQFVDEWAALGTPLYGQQAVALAAPQQVGGGKQLEATFRFSGAKGAVVPLKVVLVEGAQDPSLLVDANGDGTCTPEEAAAVATDAQHPPGFAPPTQPVWVAELQQPIKRTVAFRLSAIPGMIVMALRGYAAGEVTCGDGAHRLSVVDTNANLMLDEGTDTLAVDLNNDGKLDGPGERLSAASSVDIADRLVQPTLGASFQSLALTVQPAGEVPVRFAIAALKAPPVKLLASVQRQGGGAILLQSLSQPAKMRTGDYSIESLSVGVRGANGKNMYYNFERTGKGVSFPVRIGGPASVEMIGKLRLVPRWSLEGPNGEALKSAAPGTELRCEVDAVTATGLKLTGCNTGTEEENYPTQVPPRMTLLDPAGKVLFSGAMTFG